MRQIWVTDNPSECRLQEDNTWGERSPGYRSSAARSSGNGLPSLSAVDAANLSVLHPYQPSSARRPVWRLTLLLRLASAASRIPEDAYAEPYRQPQLRGLDRRPQPRCIGGACDTKRHELRGPRWTDEDTSHTQDILTRPVWRGLPCPTLVPFAGRMGHGGCSSAGSDQEEAAEARPRGSKTCISASLPLRSQAQGAAHSGVSSKCAPQTFVLSAEHPGSLLLDGPGDNPHSRAVARAMQAGSGLHHNVTSLPVPQGHHTTRGGWECC